MTEPNEVHHLVRYLSLIFLFLFHMVKITLVKQENNQSTVMMYLLFFLMLSQLLFVQGSPGGSESGPA